MPVENQHQAQIQTNGTCGVDAGISEPALETDSSAAIAKMDSGTQLD